MGIFKPKSLILPKLVKAGLYTIYGLVLILFFTIVYSHVFSSQLGTADDAAIALAARNLAEGNGYATSASFDGVYGIDKFSEGITTGPTLVLPAALLILIFGNTLWVPGFVVTTFCLILLVLIFRSLQKQTNLMRALLFSNLLIFFFYNITAGLHFTNWYVLLGEIPATFLGILAVILLAGSPNNRKVIIYSGFLFGLAFTTKMLSLLSFLPIIGWFVFSLIKAKHNRKKLIINYLLAVLAFLIPYLLFEIWKLLSLGFAAYIENWYAFINLFDQLSGTNDNSSVFALFPTRSKEMLNHFGFTPLLLVLIGGVVAFLIYKYSNNTSIKIVFTILMLGAVSHLLYWVFLSTGWHRYALIGLLLYFAAISCIVFLKLPTPVLVPLVLILIIIFISPLSRLRKPIIDSMNQRYSYNTRLSNLLKTIEFLNNHEKNKPFISGWWASIVDVEYAMPDLENFKRFDHLDMDDYTRDLLLVRNKIYTDFHHYPGYDEWEKKCIEVVFEAPPYIVSLYKHNTKSLKSGSVIDFSEGGNSNDYLIYGWSHQEKYFRWTNGRNAGLLFSINNKSKDSLEIKLQGFGYLGKSKIKHQLVSISANKKFVGYWEIKEEEWYEVIIPPEFLTNNETVLIDFKLKNAAAPAALLNSYDNRLLGIGVKKIEISVLNND